MTQKMFANNKNNLKISDNAMAKKIENRTQGQTVTYKTTGN